MMIYKVIFQIIKEYWFSLLIAIGWSLFTNPIHLQDPNWSLVKNINILATTFFIVSWFSGQYFRIRKHVLTEDQFQNIQTKVNSLIAQLEFEVKELINHITGGESFCYWRISSPDPNSNKGMEIVMHHGRHTIFDIQARIVDLEKMESLNDPTNFNDVVANCTMRTYKSLIPDHIHAGSLFDLGEGSQRSFNVFWTASNGSFEQMIRYKKIETEWLAAIRVVRSGVVLHEEIPGNFPKNEKDEIDW